MTTADPGQLRERMVGEVMAGRRPVAATVTEAMRAVPRHVFLPDLPPEAVYRDEAIVTKRDAGGQPISSSSQPTIMAIMLDQLGLAPGHRVLEIGAGTGYNAALLKRIVGLDGAVVSIDLDRDLTEQAEAHLAAAGYQDVTVVCADGAAGYPDQAPYDRVIATVRVDDLAPAWLDQLAPGGRIVVPLSLRGAQRSVAFERANRHWQSRSVVPCGFMRMRGMLAGTDGTQATGAELSVSVHDDRPLDIAAVAHALAGVPAECLIQVVAGAAELFDGLGLWLAVNEPAPGVLSGSGAATAPLARAPVAVRDRRFTVGVFADESFAVLARPEELAVPPEGPGAPGPRAFPLSALGYGPHGPDLAAELAAQVRAWDTAGRPGSADLTISAYPSGSVLPVATRAVIRRPHTTFVVDAERDGAVRPGRWRPA